MSDKAAGQKVRSPEGGDENGPAAALLLSHVSIQICSFLSPVRLGPPCRRPLLIATPPPQSLTWCTRLWSCFNKRAGYSRTGLGVKVSGLREDISRKGARRAM